MNSNKIKVTVIQHRCSDDIEANKQQIETAIIQASKQGAQLVVLPELHNTLYFCQSEKEENFDLAETIPGPSTAQLSELAHDYNLVIVASLFEKRAAGLYHNTAVVFETDGSIAGTYRKMHIPDDPGYYEKYYFAPGDLGFTPISTSVGKLGILICWDQWFPEAARLMALAGADMLIYPTAIGWNPNDAKQLKTHELDAWITIQRSHAIANGLPVIVANRCGLEEDITPAESTPPESQINFWGNSFVAGSQGEVIVQAKTSPAIFSAEINLSKIESTRRAWPYLRDRRIDEYQGLLKRFID